MRSNDPPFDFQFDQQRVEHLCRDQEWECPEIQPANKPFGLADIFKEYANLPHAYALRLTMEHGLKFDDNRSELAKKTIYNTFITSSKSRSAVIEREPGKRAIPIGFAFLYGKALFDKFGLEAIPESARRGTLVLPFKSTPTTTVYFDHATYAEKIKSLPKQFQPAYVCLYWADIIKDKELTRIYQDAGVPVVTAGHRYDPLFLHRFYDLCRRFRYSASNEIGTNLFLSVESGCRFFYLLGPELKCEVIQNIKIDSRKGSLYEQNRKESHRLFAKPVEEITPEQRAFVDSFLGTEHFVSPDILRRILLREQRLFEKRPWWHGEKQLLAPPDASSFTWNKIPPCRGWYIPEKEGDTTFRWMGLTDDAWVDLSYPHRLRKRAALIYCQIQCLACEHLEISVNDIRIPDIKLTQQGNELQLEGTVSPEIMAKPLSKGIIRIGFHISKGIYPNELDPDNPETRRLGVAISQISLQPKPKRVDATT